MLCFVPSSIAICVCDSWCASLSSFSLSVSIFGASLEVFCLFLLYLSMVAYFDLCYFPLLFITFCVNLYLTQYVLDIFFERRPRGMKVVGIQEMKGVSKKTGKPYDSVVLYVTGEAKDVVGCITDNIWVPRDVWDSQVGEPVSDAFIGMDVYPAYDRRGFLQSLNMK